MPGGAPLGRRTPRLTQGIHDVGTNAFFSTTCWTLVRGAGVDHSELEKLLRAYWSPIYAFIRRKGYTEHDAADLTQEFMQSVVLGRDLVAKADPSRGRFRSYLKQALRNFLIDRHRAKVARGPTPVALPGTVRELDADGPGAGGPADESPEARRASDAFDRQWAATVLRLTLQRVEAECLNDGLDRHWEAFERNIVRPTVRGATPLPLDTLAEKVGAGTADQASAMIQTIKRRFRRTLREVVLETIDSPDFVEDELATLKRLMQ